MIFGLGVLTGGVVVYLFGKRKKNIGHGLTRMHTDELMGIERRVYDVLVKGDGVGFFVKVSEEVGISRKEMGEVVKGLKKKGILRGRSFANRRKLYVVDFLNKREMKVLDFVGRRGEASFGEIMKECGVDDNLLGRMGKKFVKMGLIVKVARGYDVWWVLVGGVKKK